MRFFLPLLALSLLGACASMDTQVRTRAARDLSCKQDAMRIVDREATVFRVAGCGSFATYECHELPTLAMQCDRVRHDDPEQHEVTTATGKYSLSRAR
jgi:hypothetical protein